MKIKKVLGFLGVGVVLLTCLALCSDDTEETEEKKPKSENASVIDASDITQIARTKRENTVPMGEEGTWNIFVYLCGTDLESDGGMASGDIDEMLAVSGNSNVKFIVQTGGTKKWTKKISSKQIERYEICNGKMTLADTLENGNMGDGDVLSDFLRWGAKNYPAAKNGLVLWNHGGGSVSGVCFDERTDDSLSLREIDAALYNTRSVMTDDYEFIGFDACLMGSIEAASILASHSRYMIASEELEPGAGWDYTAIGNYLCKNSGADGYSLGKEICDSYYNACKSDNDDGMATLSLIDLSKIDNVIVKFRQFSEELYNNADNDDKLSEYIRKIRKEESYGGNSFWEGYSNMVDLKGAVNAGKEYSSLYDDAIKAVDEAVVYMRNGKYHEKSCGLSVYYPLKVDESAELKVFKDICVSTHYLAFVDKIIYGALKGTLDTYHDVAGILNSLIDWTSDFFDLEETEDGEEYYSYDEYDESDDDDESFWDILFGDYDDEEYDDDDDESIWDIIFGPDDDCEEDEDYDFWSDLFDDSDDCIDRNMNGDFDVIFDEQPSFDNEGNYGFRLSEKSLKDSQSVSSFVYMISDDMEKAIDLGITSDLVVDWETGKVKDNFDGSWFCLDDGQPLAVYLLEEGNGYDIFTSPVKVNGKETNLRFSWNYNSGEIDLLGIWDGIEKSGICSRGGEKLNAGDVIVPLYNAFNIDTDKEYQFKGDNYTFSGKSRVQFDYLPDGGYLYGFILEDIFSNTYATDVVYFEIADDEISYSNIE